MARSVDKLFWKGKRVFITGHTGFKGSWLSFWLNNIGAQVKGYALEASTKPSLFEQADIGNYIESEIGDIRNPELLLQSMTKFNPDILIHMAAQPLVRLSYRRPIETYETNVMGTVYVLEAARQCNNLKAIVNVTTDKCYENKEWAWGYRETEPMGGYDPYSSSKGCSELVTLAYRRSFFDATKSRALLASARAGNVIGGGDWAHDRLIPDILRAFEKTNPAFIRNPLAIRPWQHVLEPLSGYLLLAEQLFSGDRNFADSWNFGPYDQDVRSVEWVADEMSKLWGEGTVWKKDNSSHLHEAQLLKLDISKAVSKLNWQPRWTLIKALEKIIEWHKGFISKGDIQEIMVQQIQEYQSH